MFKPKKYYLCEFFYIGRYENKKLHIHVLFCPMCSHFRLIQIHEFRNFLKDHITNFAFLSLIYSIFIHVMLLTIISQRIKPYFRFPDILKNLLIFQNQIFK
ncbi:hypothetical protein LDENG_00214250 [Lucifuga dentata]|nr:hypothetical protein LDENG_00214250 [Lucifuga dentata]